MRQNQIILEFSSDLPDYSTSALQETLAESLWDTIKDESLHMILRESALLELARRKEPGVLAYCDKLILSEDEECWFSALKALETLNTYDATQRLLVICGYSGTRNRNIAMNSLARILTSSHTEGFRRILRSSITPGVLDVTGWSPTALRVLMAVCIEQNIEVETSIYSLAQSIKRTEICKKDSTLVRIPEKKRKM